MIDSATPCPQTERTPTSIFRSTTIGAGQGLADPAAALVSTAKGKVTLANTNAVYGEKTVSSTSGKVRVRVHIKRGTLTMTSSTQLTFCYARYSSTSSVAGVNLVRDSSGNYCIQAYYYNDASGTAGTDYYTIDDNAHYVESYLVRATSSTSNNGTLSLWIDGSLKETMTGISNYDHFAVQPDQARRGRNQLGNRRTIP